MYQYLRPFCVGYGPVTVRYGTRRGDLKNKQPTHTQVTPLNNPGCPEGDTVTVDEQLLNTEY